MTAPSSERGSRGLLLILAGTAAAGVSGYAIQILAPALLDDADSYLVFSAFWSLLFLLGSVVGGIQQEIARATTPDVSPTAHRSIRGFAIGCAVVISVITGAIGLLVGPTAFGPAHLPIVGALVIGMLGYVMTAVLMGLFYGLGSLGSVAALIAVDAGLRGIAVVIGMVVGAPIDLLAYLIALPFGLAVLIVWRFARSRVVGRYALDSDNVVLAQHALTTMVAAASVGVMVTGMPLLFRLSLTELSTVALASLTLVVTLTRAPFIIPLMALQSYLVVSFRDQPDRVRPRVRLYLLFAVGVGVVAALIMMPAGPWIVSILSGGDYSTTPVESAAVVMSAILVGCMCITGPALLAQGEHGAYASGWVVAAIVTGIILFLPIEPAAVRSMVALSAGPVAGLGVHGVRLAARTSV